MELTGAHPTHRGAEMILTELRDDLDEYAAEVERVYTPVWDCRVDEPVVEEQASVPTEPKPLSRTAKVGGPSCRSDLTDPAKGAA